VFSKRYFTRSGGDWTMSNAQPEPSMEEILASIRRIISEDEDDSKPLQREARPSSVPKQAVAPAPEPVYAREEADPRHAPPVPSGREGDDITEALEMTRQTIASYTEAGDAGLLAEETTTATTKAFRSLSQSVRISRSEGLTLEDIVTELVRPLVKEWLEANLPTIVEEKVEEEVQRLARRPFT
jgi:cell pole-organizing protein PopZ